MSNYHSKAVFFRYLILFTLLGGLFGNPSLSRALTYNGWTLTHNDQAYNLSVLDRMPEFGVTHVQLSHAIITRIDQLKEDSVVSRVRDLAEKIHSHNGKVIVWAQELPFDTKTFCFDLDGDDMQARMEAYRYGLKRVPEIDGVMISFGSAPTELDSVIPTGPGALSFIPRKERYKAMIEAVSRVVEDEFGKQVLVRTFFHKSVEAGPLASAMQETGRPIVVMSKAEPNDFEPYYPLNPLVGNIGNHPQILEFDAAGEYWGRGAIPFVASEYFTFRYWQAMQKADRTDTSIIGSTSRIDRYERSAMGTLNEANIYAQAYLSDTPSGTWDEPLKSFILGRYGISPDTTEAETLLNILRRTFWIGKKMYYVMGEWAFTKGSDLPESNPDALANQFNKTIAQWDVNYAPVFMNLISPDLKTIQRVLQEKSEAVDLAEQNLASLAKLRHCLSPEDYLDLKRFLLKQKVATKIWYHMAGAVFGKRSVSIKSRSDVKAWMKWHLNALETLAADLENGAYPLITDFYPFSPDDIHTLVENTRKLILWKGKAEAPQWLKIDAIRLIGADTDTAGISWLAEEGVKYRVELTQQLPIYTQSIVYDGPAGETKFTIQGLKAGTPYWFRIYAETENDFMTSGDFSFWTEQ